MIQAHAQERQTFLVPQRLFSNDTLLSREIFYSKASCKRMHNSYSFPQVNDYSPLYLVWLQTDLFSL